MLLITTSLWGDAPVRVAPRLQPYAEWSKTPAAKTLMEFVRHTVSSLIAREKLESRNGDAFPWIQQPVGVFVTAMKGRKVRVCVGAFTPSEETMGREIVRQCKRLIAEDPRHEPLSPYELDQLQYVVSFVGSPTPIADPSLLDIWSEGLLMRWGEREAALLPGEAKTLSWGASALRRQIQVPQHETPSYASFPVVVIREEISPESMNNTNR